MQTDNYNYGQAESNAWSIYTGCHESQDNLAIVPIIYQTFLNLPGVYIRNVLGNHMFTQTGVIIIMGKVTIFY